MIAQNPFHVTEKDHDFLQDYDYIKNFITVIVIKYFDISVTKVYGI